MLEESAETFGEPKSLIRKLERFCLMVKYKNSTMLLIVMVLLTFLCGTNTYAEDTAEELAMEAQNPVADLISIPFQNDLNFGLGPHNRAQNILNIQPVVPLHMTDNFNLITRTIVPIIRQPDLAQDKGATNGLGDINLSLFFSPSKVSKVIWGVGPALQFPTATDEVLGSRKWSAGPSGVVLTIQGPWLFGALSSQIWSYAGNDDRKKVSQFLLQPFLNYNFEGGFYFTSGPEITANWEAPSGDKWKVPVGGGVGKVVNIYNEPINTRVEAYYNVQQATFDPDWTLRVRVQFLFPK